MMTVTFDSPLPLIGTVGAWTHEIAQPWDVEYIGSVLVDGATVCKVRHLPGQSKIEALENMHLMAGARTMMAALQICASQQTVPGWTAEQALAVIKNIATEAIAQTAGYKAPVADETAIYAHAHEMLSALQRLTHPSADEDDLDFATEVIAKATRKA